MYPGSLKGPEPEDDPETYSRWFFEHQPKSLYSDQTNPTYDDIGVKKKFLRMVRDDSSMNEIKTTDDYFFNQDELYPMQNYEGQPEFELFNRENFNADTPD